MNLERSLGDELADQTPFNHRIGDARIGVQQITLFLNDEVAEGAKVF